MTDLRRIIDLLRLPAGETCVAIVLGALAVGFGVALLTVSGYLISRAAEQPPILSLTVVIAAVRVFGLARPVARYLERLATHDVALRSLGRARVTVYGRVEPLAPVELAAYRRGDLLSRMVGDVDALQALVPRVLTPPAVALIVGGASVVAVGTVSVAAATVLGVGLALAGCTAPLATASGGRHSGAATSGARAEMTAELVEAMRSAPELAVNGGSDAALTRIRGVDARLLRLGRRSASAVGIGDALVVVLTGVTTAGVLACATAAHHAGDIRATLIAATALLALASFEAVAPLVGTARDLPEVRAAGKRVLDVVERRPHVVDPEEPEPVPPRESVVALENVGVRYPGASAAVLAHTDLVLEPGRRIALLGRSGAGKTTVVRLLLRFLDPEEGRITIGGVDLRRMTQTDVRSFFALAGQDAHVFDSTIRANLLLAKPSASEGELWSALRVACLEEWARALPHGLDTMVGEEGNRLSGGQRQRLVIARALLSNAPVLILDEPTAHLDAPTARALVSDVLSRVTNRTILLITHRTEGLDLVDEIVRLDDTSDL